MSEEKLMLFGIAEDKFKDYLVKTVEAYPFARSFDEIVSYEVPITDSGFFHAKKNEDVDVLADFVFFSDWRSGKDYLNDNYRAGLGLGLNLDPMDNDVIRFIVKMPVDDLKAEVIFGGKYRDSSEEERNKMVNDFLLAMNRIGGVAEAMTGIEDFDD